MIYYFAYGSNMDREYLDCWCKQKSLPKVEFLSILPAKLNDYKLTFNYFSATWKAGTANIMKSVEDCVYGLLLEIEDDDLTTIRKKVILVTTRKFLSV